MIEAEVRLAKMTIRAARTLLLSSLANLTTAAITRRPAIFIKDTEKYLVKILGWKDELLASKHNFAQKQHLRYAFG